MAVGALFIWNVMDAFPIGFRLFWTAITPFVIYLATGLGWISLSDVRFKKARSASDNSMSHEGHAEERPLKAEVVNDADIQSTTPRRSSDDADWTTPPLQQLIEGYWIIACRKVAILFSKEWRTPTTCVLLFVLYMAWSKPGPGSTRDANPADDSNHASPNREPSFPDRSITREKTIAYWTGVREIERRNASFSSAGRQSPQAIANAFELIASGIDSLPTANVDPRAVEYGISLAALVRKMAVYARRQNDPAMLVTAFLTGASGDLNSVRNMVESTSNEKSMIESEFLKLREQSSRVRAALTAEYNYPFPN